MILMKYIYKAIHEDGRVSKAAETKLVHSEEEGKDFIRKWNIWGRFPGYPQWVYKLWRFENVHTDHKQM